MRWRFAAVQFAVPVFFTSLQQNTCYSYTFTYSQLCCCWLYQYLQFVTRFWLAGTIFAIFTLQAEEMRPIGHTPSIAWLFFGFDPFDPV